MMITPKTQSTPIKAVLFDLDGTLVDTARDFVYIIEQLAREHGLAVPSEVLILEKVSAGALAMVSLFKPAGFKSADLQSLELQKTTDSELTEEQVLAYRQQFLDKYAQNICIKSHLYDGLDELLSILDNQGIAWGVVTNKPRYLSERLLQALDLTQRCAVLVCPEDVTHTKPDPEPLYLALDTLAIAPSEADSVIYIGDHIRDIQAGKQAGMITMVAGYGYISEEQRRKLADWGADEIVQSSQDLRHRLMCYITKE